MEAVKIVSVFTLLPLNFWEIQGLEHKLPIILLWQHPEMD